MAKTKRRYEHSAYWYAMNYGWTYSDKSTCVGRLLDEARRDLMFRDRRTDNGMALYNPIGFGICLAVCTAMDIGTAMRETVRKVSDPVERDRMRRELLRDLRAVRRPFYYARETARRRELAAERRKVTRRTTTAPMPTPEEILAAWGRRKDSKADMIRLGGMLQDLECYVDNALRFDGNGNVVGRNGGIRGWLRKCLPELSPKYKTLMRYKAMAIRLRQATGTEDPTPTSALLEEGPGAAAGRDGGGEAHGICVAGGASGTRIASARGAHEAGSAAHGGGGAMHEVVRELLQDFRMTFSSLEEGLRQRLDPERVFLDPARKGLAGKRKTRKSQNGKGLAGKRRETRRERKRDSS